MVITLVKGLIKCHPVVEGMDRDGGFRERVHKQRQLPLPVMIDLTGGEWEGSKQERRVIHVEQNGRQGI